MHAQHLCHQLVGICSPVKGAGTRAVVGLNLRGQHFITANFSLGKKLTGMSLFPVGQARGHGTRRNQNHGQVTKLETSHEQARHNFIADPQQSNPVEHVMGETNHRGHGNYVPADQAHIHARFALSNAVAHGGYAACKLSSAPCSGNSLFYDFWIGLIGLVG